MLDRSRGRITRLSILGLPLLAACGDTTILVASWLIFAAIPARKKEKISVPRKNSDLQQILGFLLFFL
jgi:hypothetical protein